MYLVQSLIRIDADVQYKALARDDFRCMVTGMLDHRSVGHCQALLHESLNEDITMSEIQTAHIFNGSTLQGIDPEGGGKEGATMNKVPSLCRVLHFAHALSRLVMRLLALWPYWSPLDSQNSLRLSDNQGVFTKSGIYSH